MSTKKKHIHLQTNQNHCVDLERHLKNCMDKDIYFLKKYIMSCIKYHPLQLQNSIQNKFEKNYPIIFTEKAH